MRGRARGGGSSRGRGRGPGSWHGGPKLPAKLAKELFGGEGRAGNRPVQGLPRKERRKAERQEANKGCRQAGRGGQQWEGKPQRGPPARSQPVNEPADHPTRKRQRLDDRGRSGPGSPPPTASGGNRFKALLPATLGGQDAERELQRELARKLGLKKCKKEKGSEDGLDDLLEGFGGMDERLSESEDEGPPPPRQAQRGARVAKQQWQQRGRGRSDESDGSEGDGFSESESEGEEEGEEGGSDLEDILLGDSEKRFGEEEEGEGEEAGCEQEGCDREGGGLSEGEGTEGSSEDQGEGLGSESEEAGSSSNEGGSEGEGSEEEEEELDSGAQGGAELPPAAQQRKQPSGAACGEGAAAAAAPGAAAGGGKYVPPAVRRVMEAAAAGGGDSEAVRIGRRVRGLLNRMAEANIHGVVGDLAALYEEEGRRVVSNAVCSELLQAAAEGPRASDRFAAVTAAALAGLAASTSSSEILANFLDRLAARLEEATGAGESLTCHNLSMVVASLYACGAIRPDLLYSLLSRLKARFLEADISMMATLLKACGLQLRADNPVAMKDFVVSVHARAAEAGGASSLSKRGQSMLELVVDIKNNRRREGKGGEVATVLSPAIGKWLKSLGVAEVSVGGITWDKILTTNKKGIWWMPTAADAVPQEPAARAALRAATAAAVDKEGGVAGPELIKLAAALRMNTDVRRAVFCIVMGSEDCMDAFEKLLRLPLKGEQEREVVRVAVECCLQEKAWNPYYALLLGKLCEASKSHKITLQYCLWDQLKEVAEGLEVRRLTNLARLMATVIAGGGLPSTVLKVADFAEGISAREVLFWRIFFEHLLAACRSRQAATALFQKVAAQPQLKQFKAGLALFLRRTFGPWLAAQEPGSSGFSDAQLASLLGRLQAVEKVLGSNVVG